MAACLWALGARPRAGGGAYAQSTRVRTSKYYTNLLRQKDTNTRTSTLEPSTKAPHEFHRTYHDHNVLISLE